MIPGLVNPQSLEEILSKSFEKTRFSLNFDPTRGNICKEKSVAPLYKFSLMLDQRNSDKHCGDKFQVQDKFLI